MLKAILLFSLIGAVASWNYDDPENDWCSEASVCCDGTRQSPIDLDSAGATEDTTFDDFDPSPAYWNLISGVLLNDGHSVKFNVDNPDEVTITGGSLGSSVYKLAQFHFHTGRQGSEHTVDGQRYKGEVHLVHYKSTHADLSAAVASGEGDALAVLGFFILVTTRRNGAFQELYPSMKLLKDSTSDSDEFPMMVNLANILAQAGTKEFYTYDGSLTTPTCNEIVKWTVFNKPVYMRKNVWKKIRQTRNEDGVRIYNNYRPVVTTNMNTVTRSFEL